MRDIFYNVFALAFLLLSAPAVVFGKSPSPPSPYPTLTGLRGNSGGIVPCDGPSLPSSVTQVPSNYVPCDYNRFIDLLQNIITWVIYVMAIVAAILFAWAGFLYLTSGGNSSQVQKAHRILKMVITGIIIVLVAWIIVNTIVELLLNKKSFINPLG